MDVLVTIMHHLGPLDGCVASHACRVLRTAYRHSGLRWRETTLYVESADGNPYTCCQVENCQCVDAAPNITTCSDAVGQHVSTACDNGYHCCITYYYICGFSSSYVCGNDYCRWIRVPRYCSACGSHVDRRACETSCATCYNLTAVLRYYNDERGAWVRTIVTTPCGRGDAACAQAFVDSYSDTARPGYYDKDDENTVTFDRGFNPTLLAFLFIFAAAVVSMAAGFSVRACLA